MGFPIRRSPDQRVLSPPRRLSQSATSFIASRCLGIHQVPLSRLRSVHGCKSNRIHNHSRLDSIRDKGMSLEIWVYLVSLNSRKNAFGPLAKANLQNPSNQFKPRSSSTRCSASEEDGNPAEPAQPLSGKACKLRLTRHDQHFCWFQNLFTMTNNQRTSKVRTLDSVRNSSPQPSDAGRRLRRLGARTPVGHSPSAERWWRRTGSNRRPEACKATALPTELRPRSPYGSLVNWCRSGAATRLRRWLTAHMRRSGGRPRISLDAQWRRGSLLHCFN